MVQTRGKNAMIVLSSDESEEEEEGADCGCEDSDFEDSDCEEASESDDSGGDLDDSSLSDKVVALLREGNDLQSLKLNECKAYLRKHGLRIAGNRDVCIARINEHWRLKHGSGYTLFPRSSFSINCTGDVCMGDVVLFRQKVYQKFDKVTRHGKLLGNRTVAGRVVKESYGAAKQQHTFTVEVLWSSGVRKLPLLSPLLVKGRNLYKQKTYRQRWKNEADRIEVLREKHNRGAEARSTRALKQKTKSYSNEFKGSKRKHEMPKKKRSKIERPSVVDKDRHQDGFKRANKFPARGAITSTQTIQKENASSRDSRYTRERHESAEFDRYHVSAYPLYDSFSQSAYQYQVNSQNRNEPSEFFYHNRGLVPNMTVFPSFRPCVGEFTSRSRDQVYNRSPHAHTNLYDYGMKSYAWRK